MASKDPPRTTTVWLPPLERALIETAAAARGEGPSTFLRRAAVETARRELEVTDGPPDPEADEVAS